MCMSTAQQTSTIFEYIGKSSQYPLKYIEENETNHPNAEFRSSHLQRVDFTLPQTNGGIQQNTPPISSLASQISQRYLDLEIIS